VRSGTYSARFQSYRGDKLIYCGVRSELAGDVEPPRAAAGTPTERWYGFSIYLPHTWFADPAPESVTQWHQDDNSPGGSPPLAILTAQPRPTVNDKSPVNRWYVGQRQWNVNDVTLHDAGTCRLGEWTDWVVHVKWSADANGLLEVWKNGTLVAPFNPQHGRNTFSNDTLHYIKIGIHKWIWNAHAADNLTPQTHCGQPQPDTSVQHRRVMYHDELRITGATGSRAAVAPPGNRPPSVS
jgi:hypothetical protein